MKVKKLYFYPIKSLRPCDVDAVEVTKYGFAYDRHFMLLKISKDENDKDSTSPGYKNMAVASYPEMVLFFTSVAFPAGDNDASSTAKITVEYKPPKNSGKSDSKLEIPLVPDVADLEQFEVLMHRSPTQAYKMPAHLSDWFSECFGYEVVLAYVGDYRRKVLMSASSRPGEPRRQEAAPSANGAAAGAAAGGGGGWLSSVTSLASKATQLVVGGGGGQSARAEPEITFSDCAPYLVVSEKSMEDVHKRLPAGESMDITKFRPNIIVSGAADVWEEDYWGEITVGSEGTRIECAQNCARCQSINIDYETGYYGKGESGKMLKLLMKDRRVDPGMKWSPIFGRYSFLVDGCEGNVIRVGDEVVVSRRNEERTRFDWEGLSTK